MAAVQHEPVAAKVVQFLPAPPPPRRPSLLPPSQLSQSSSLTLPLGLFTVDMVGFFFFSSFLFPPPLQPANKSLALSPGSVSPCCSLTLSVIITLTLPLSTVDFSYSSWSRAPPPPLPLSSFASPPPPRSALLLRQCESAGAVRLLLPQRAGLKRSAWELAVSLSLSHPHPRLSLHAVMREQLCGR